MLAWIKNYCYWPSLHISFIWSPVLGNCRFWKRTVPSTLNFCIFNLRRPSGGLFIFFISFIQLLQDKREKKWALITELKYDWSLNKFDWPLSSLFSRNRISSRGEEIIWFLAFSLISTYELFAFIFRCFFKCQP